VKPETLKRLNIAQGLEDRTRQFTRQVNVALNTVIESDPNFEAAYIMRVNYSGQHKNYSRGSIFGSDFYH
jgi:hypothetical protein